MQKINAERVLEHIHAVNEAATSEQVFKTFTSAAHDYGFDHILLGHLANPLNLPFEDILHFSTWPQELIEHRLKSNAILDDPIARFALGTKRTFRWADATKHATTAGLEVVNAARDYGLHTGYLFPMHSMHGVTGAVSLGAKQISVTSDEIAELEFLCSASYYRLEALKGVSPYHNQPNLSPREVEVLQLVSTGKLNVEVAKILGIQEDTVKKHLVSAREKLGAVNRTHAVSKAIATGQIFP